MRRHWILFLFLAMGVVTLGLTSGGKVQVFNSSLTMKVFVRMASDVPDRVLGFTPVAKGHRIRVNPGTFWYVRPDGRLNGAKMDRLASDIRRYGIPGLDLSDHWELTDASLLHLSHLSSLRLLDISRTRLTKNSASALATLKNLSILSAPEAFDDHSLVVLKKLTKIRDLTLDRSHVTDEGLKALLSHPMLENLDLSGTNITDAGLTVLKGLPNLKRLVLPGRITNAAMPTLRAIRSLQRIDISQTQITDEGLSALAALPNLQSIYFNRSISDVGLEHLSSSRSLESLDLSGAKVTDAGMKSLAKIITLQELDISQTPIDDAGLSELSKLPNLRMLEISDTRVTNAGLAPLAKLRHLEILSLSWQRLTRDDLRAMGRLPQVKTMVLNGVPLSDNTMHEMQRLSHAGPWERPRGIEQAGLDQSNTPSASVLTSPVNASKAVIPAVEIQESAHGLTSPLIHTHPLSSGPPGLHAQIPASPAASHTLAARSPKSSGSGVDSLQTPSSPEVASAALKNSHASDDVLTREQLKNKNNSYAISEVPARSPTDDDIIVTKAKPSSPEQKTSEDDLLKKISQQSDPSKHGGFGGLAGMRQIRVAQNSPGLTDMDNGAVAKIKMQEDTPENSLGEIEVGAGHSR